MTRQPVLFLLSLLVLFPFATFAQDEGESQIYAPGSTWRNEKVERIREQKRESLSEKGYIVPEEIQVALVRREYMDDGQVGLLLSVPDVVNGCFDYTPLEYEATFIDPYYFDIKVRHYRRTVIKTDNVASGCNAGNRVSTALIVLSRKDLEERGTQEIRFSVGSAFDRYTINISDNTLTLIPDSMVIFKAQGLTGPDKDRIVFPFTGSGRVALHIPMAHKGEDVKEEIENFARRKALTPDPENPVSYGTGGSPVYHFLDDGGNVVSMIGEDGYAEVGEIVVGRPYDGPDGRRDMPVSLKIFAARPGVEL